VNLVAARDAGMLVATLFHPWNEEIAREDGVLAARTWPELGEIVNGILPEPDRL
jgi:hypothetical protein